MSYINTSYNSVTRMSGLSGLDVDSLVFQLMQVEKVKINSVTQSRQLLYGNRNSTGR
jgi:flagellar capping protein FliD